MTDLAVRRMCDYIASLDTAFKNGGKALAIKSINANSFAEVMTHLEGLTRESIDEVSSCQFKKQERQIEMIEHIQKARSSVLNNMMARDSSASGPIINDVTLSQLQGIASHIEDKDINAVSGANRSEMMKATEELIEEVHGWNMSDYAKTSLLLKLNAVQRIIQAADTFPESEIRMRVKGIIADFAVEYESIDQKYQTRLERIVKWAKRGFFVGGATLGLTSDAAGVVALLEAPVKRITSQ